MQQNTLWVQVETWANGSLEDQRVINQYDYRDRIWLARHAWWAMHNGREIRTRAQ